MPQTPIFQPGHPIRVALEASQIRFRKFLGRGGFNEAWEVERDGARLCLKISIVPLDDPKGQTAYERKSLEIYENPRIAQHAFIVGFHGQQVVAGHLATFWELGGRTMLDVLQEKQARGEGNGLSWKELVSDPHSRSGYLWSVAQATDDFNQLGHQHRDLKPENLFVFFGNQVKLGDLGMAARVGMTTHHSMHVLGTRGYQPPEALSGQWNKTSDHYAFAATYLKLRTGREPFGDESPTDVYERQRAGAPLLDGLEPFERVPLLQALAPLPANRPQDGVVAFLRVLQPGRGDHLAPPLPAIEPTMVTITPVEIPPVQVQVQPVVVAPQETLGLPAISPEVMNVTGQALGCDQAIDELRSGTHPALRAGAVAVQKAEQQEREMLAELQAHQPKLPAAVCQQIADAVAANPGGPVTPLLKQALNAVPKAEPDEVIEYIHRVRNARLASSVKQQAQAAFAEARQREIQKLVERRKQLGDKLADWQRTDLGDVVELLRRTANGSRHFPLREWQALQPALLSRYGKKKSDIVELLEQAEHLYLGTPQRLTKTFGYHQPQTKALGMEMVEISKGECLIGSPDGVGEANERPQHLVRFAHPFLLGKYPVTVGQFRKFVQATGYSACGNDWQSPGFAQTDDHPVVNVSYDDAMAMAAWLTKMERESYTLPTEAEWEYACRAGTTTLHYGGDDLAWLRTNANIAGSHSGTTRVGQFAANPWGLCDMLGNCWEWVADWYDGNYYRQSPATDPPGPSQGQYRVLRGGSWANEEKCCRSGFRNVYAVSNRNYCSGFRLCIRLS